MAVNGFLLNASTSTNIGHPNALQTDTNQDPGYGYTSQSSIYSYTKNGVISNNIFRNCVRRGIDSHSHERLAILNNNISDCWNSGIYFAWSSATQPTIGTIIANNTIVNCSTAKSKSSAIYTQGLIDANYSYDNVLLNAIIKNNLIRNCGSITGDGIIHIRNGRNVTIEGNLIYGASLDAVSNGINVGRANDISYQISVINNVIDASGNTNLSRGIQVYNANDSVVANNVVKLDHANANIGIYHVDASTTDYYNNRVNVNAGTPIAISPSLGTTHSNQTKGGTASSNLFSTNTTDFKMPSRIALSIAFNGTSSPTVTYLSGSNYISSVTTSANGVKVSFKNLTSSVKLIPTFTNNSAKGLLVGTNPVQYLYVRSLSYAVLEVGTKMLQADPSGVDGSTITAGTLIVTIDVM